MGPEHPGVRRLVAGDLDWVAERQQRRREAMAAHAPRFWRPAPGVAAAQRAASERMLADPDTVMLRTDDGYLIGTVGARHRLVDDMDVDADQWATQGVGLLDSARALGPVRLVVPVPATERRAGAELAGMRLVDTWWHHDLPLVQVREEGGPVELSAPGATGRLVTAPPTFDPGGPILLVTAARNAVDLAAIERSAAERGATVALATQRAGDLDAELVLLAAGFTPTAVFLEG